MRLGISSLFMKPILNWIKDHLAATMVIVFGLAAGVPWAASAVKVAQNGQEVTLTNVAKERKEMDKQAEKEKHKDDKELKSSLTSADGTLWLGTKGGLYRVVNGTTEKMSGGPQLEVRSLAETAGGLYTAGKDGVWQRAADGQWQQVWQGEAHSLSLSAGQLAVVSKKDGLLHSADAGQTWTPVALAPEFKYHKHD
jgi:ligand-binding sensor domain-containing protein